MCRRFYFHLFYLCIYISIVICGDGGIMTYTSYEGGSVNIRCPYDAQFIDNTKYLCRGKCSTLKVLAEKDIPIETGRTPDDTRFSLKDDKTATVFTITDLRAKDGGQYWCAVRRRVFETDVYREVFLSVKNVSHMSGVKGDELSVQCHYVHVINNHTFLCKGENLSLCETSGVKVSKGKVTNGRFSLIDDTSARVFTVTITKLTEEDSGIYWCGNVALGGSQQTHDKWISAVILKISEVTSESTSHNPTTASFHITHPASTDSSSRSATSSPSSLPTSSSAHSLSPNTETSLFVFIAPSVAAMLILFGFVLCIYFRRRKKNEQLQLSGVAHGSAGNQKNGEIRQTRVSVCYYEEIPLTNVHHSLVLPASGEHDASVYALAQNVSSNNLHYSTIQFTGHSDRTSDGQTSCDYATVVL